MRTLALSLLLSAPALGADLTIDDVAPPETLMVARVADMTGAMDALRATPMWTLADEPEVRDWLGEIAKSFDETELAERLGRLGVRWDEIPLPSGAAGFAVWADEEDLATPTPFIAMADFGEEDDRFFDLALDLADQLEEDGALELVVEDYGPHEVYTLTIAPGEELVETLRDQRERLRENGWTEEDLDDAGLVLPEPQVTHLARAGSVVFYSTSLDRLQAGLDAADGREIESLIGGEDVSRARERLGGADTDLVIRGDRLLELFEQGFDSMMLPLPAGLLGATGLDEIGVCAGGLRFNAEEGQAVMDFFVGVAEPVGLFALPADLNGFEPPAFVGPEVVSYLAFGLDWGEILPAARRVVLELPDETRAQADAALTAFSVAAAPILQSLEPKIYTTTSYAKPYGPESESTLMAAPVNNEAAVVAAINQYAQGLGAQVREFLGHQIWQTQALMGVPPTAVGVGAGWAFLGSPSAVESAFRRLAAQEDAVGARSLAEKPAFQLAASRVPADALMYGYIDTADWFGYVKWNVENMEELIRAQFDGQGWQPDEEFVRMMIEEAENSLYHRLVSAAPLELLTTVLGDQVQDVQRVDGGFRMRFTLLRPIR